MKTKFKCDKCGCEPEELYMFGEFGSNILKKDDRNEYCAKCFGLVSEQYESEDKQEKT